MKKSHSTILMTFALASVSALAQTSAPVAPTDAQIAAIVVAANQVDIDAGKYAKAHATTKAVKDFAQEMVVDHSAVNASATALVTKLKLTPESNPTSENLIAGGVKNVDNLKTLKGAPLNHAYVDNEVTYHQAVLDAMDQTLIPNAKNEELKALLVKVRPQFAAHLAHAKAMQTTMMVKNAK
jgi:putative membrane protein